MAQTATGPPDVAAVVLAAGRGSRMGAPVNKVFLPVGGKPILARTLELFQSHPLVSEIVVVAAAAELDECQARIVEPFGFTKVRQVIAGGRTRHESEFIGLQALKEDVAGGAVKIALVHDAVRPFTDAGSIDALIKQARRSGAAIPAIPAGPEVVSSRPDGHVEWPADDLWEAQTPQAFDARLILDAHWRAATDGFQGTDTSAVLERLGHSVVVVEGSPVNIKITTADDLVLAEQIAKDLRTVILKHPSDKTRIAD